MAIGREPKSAHLEVVEGKTGRLPAAPHGDMYVRDPAAARAQAIREKVALLHRHGQEVPQYLQALFDALDAQNDEAAIELVNAATGEQVAEVDKAQPEPLRPDVASTTDMFPPEAKPGGVNDPGTSEAGVSGAGVIVTEVKAVEPEPEPEPVATPAPKLEAKVEVKPQPEPQVEAKPEPKAEVEAPKPPVPPRRPTPPRKASPRRR